MLPDKVHNFRQSRDRLAVDVHRVNAGELLPHNQPACVGVAVLVGHRREGVAQGVDAPALFHVKAGAPAQVCKLMADICSIPSATLFGDEDFGAIRDPRRHPVFDCRQRFWPERHDTPDFRLRSAVANNAVLNVGELEGGKVGRADAAIQREQEHSAHLVFGLSQQPAEFVGRDDALAFGQMRQRYLFPSRAEDGQALKPAMSDGVIQPRVDDRDNVVVSPARYRAAEVVRGGGERRGIQFVDDSLAADVMDELIDARAGVDIAGLLQRAGCDLFASLVKVMVGRVAQRPRSVVIDRREVGRYGRLFGVQSMAQALVFGERTISQDASAAEVVEAATDFLLVSPVCPRLRREVIGRVDSSFASCHDARLDASKDRTATKGSQKAVVRSFAGSQENLSLSGIYRYGSRSSVWIEHRISKPNFSDPPVAVHVFSGRFNANSRRRKASKAQKVVKLTTRFRALVVKGAGGAR